MRERQRARILRTSIIYLVAFGYLVPVLYLTLTAFREPQAVFYVLEAGLHFSLRNFTEALNWRGVPIKEAFLNSALIATASTLLSLFITLPSGYMLARYRTRLARSWFFVVYLVRAVPYVSWVLPLFLLAQKLGLYDTYFGIIAAQAAFHVAFYSWILKGFFEGVPHEAEEAALLDGCSRWGAFFRIAVPLAIPGVVAAGILGWIWGWNELLIALFMTTETIPMFAKTVSAFITEMGVAWGRMAATGVMATVPALIVTALCYRYIVVGLGGTHKK
jgi:multiple sugar transport system permease protein